MVTFFSVEPITGAVFGHGWDCLQAPTGRAPERPGRGYMVGDVYFAKAESRRDPEVFYFDPSRMQIVDGPGRERMGTHRSSKRRRFVKAAFRRWGKRRKRPGQRPSRELRRSW